MSKKMLIDATHVEETRVVVVDGNKVEEFDFESENKRQLAGNIYLAKVTRVEPSLQAAFVDYGGNRHGFLAFSEIHPDYYQIPIADREALIAEEMAFAEAEAAEEDKPKRKRGRRKSKSKAEEAKIADETVSSELLEEPAKVEESVDAAETVNGSTNGDDAEDLSSNDKTAEKGSSKQIPGMDVVDIDDNDHVVADDQGVGDDDEPYSAMDHASETDATIESVADDDTTEEIRRPRKQRQRRYKIQEVIKVRQILLVQVVKEERGNKGAALTTYLSLAGRYCVLMPNTARGGGISRKITTASDRKKLKEIATEIDVPKGAGLIIRTAGAKRTKTEIKRDYEYLQRLWEQIRELTLKSIAPAQIYEEGNLIKRSIRDLYSREIEEVLVEGDVGYRTAKDFMKMIMPSHAKNVQHYSEPMPMFARYQVESYLGGMFNPVVQLKSGGYIVIGVTEALVAIDVNSGKATKEGSIEETALKTNLEAAEEVARQLRLRDLAGLIVIDFIDMEERRNNSSVEKRFKERLKTDRARIQVGRISGFGLLEMSRQRLRPGMLEASTQPCPSCHGTGLIRSDDSLGLTILRQLEEEGVRRRSREVLVKAPVSIVNFLVNFKREHIAQIEMRYGMAVRIESDQFLISPDFTIEKFKTATRLIDGSQPVVSVDASLMAEVEEDLAATKPADDEMETEDRPKKKRRRRRRRRGGSGRDGEAAAQADANSGPQDDANVQSVKAEGSDEAIEPAELIEENPKKSTRTRTRKKKSAEAAEAAPVSSDSEAPTEVSEKTAGAKQKRTTSTRAKKRPDAKKVEQVDVKEPAKEPVLTDNASKEVSSVDAPVIAATEEKRTPDKPRRRGWWSVGRS